MMQRDSYSANVLEIIMRSIATYAITRRPGEWTLDEQYIADLGTLESTQIKELSYLLDENHLTWPFYGTFGKLDSDVICKLKDRLKPN